MCSSEVGKVIAIKEGFCFLKMIRCRRRQATDPQKLKKLSTAVFSFFVGGSGSGGSDRCGSGSGIGSGRKITASTFLVVAA